MRHRNTLGPWSLDYLPPWIMTYNGLESCILNTSSSSCENESGTSKADGFTDSLDEDVSSCSSSKSKDIVFGSFSSQWDISDTPQRFYVKQKPSYNVIHVSDADVETMKERFAKLLLGEDITGGSKAVTTALALSNAITNLAASVFGELWKLEPLSEERKNKWRREMDWLVSPTNYMVELVPAKQNGTNGRTLEIMTPKARGDIHMNLPALQKLDSMLIETLDSMGTTEFWYAEGGSRAEGRSNNSVRQSKRWWLPSPRVPTTGLSDSERKKLLYKGKVVNQIFKAAKSINQTVLLEMPVPHFIGDALPKSRKLNLGGELCKLLTTESISAEEMLNSLNLNSEHCALETINRLEAAIFVWKQRITEESSGKSPVRVTWSLVKDPVSELNKMELLLERAETLLQLLNIRYPNLPQTFLDVTKIQYGKDIGHSVLEAYSRALANLSLSVMCRIGDILEEDMLSNPNSPVTLSSFPGLNLSRISETPVGRLRIRHSLIDQMNSVDHHTKPTNTFDLGSVTATPTRTCVWCLGVDASPKNSP